MISKLWFRFGIPLGSATVLAALLETAAASYWFLNDFGSYLYFHVWDHDLKPGYRSVVGLVAVSGRLILAFSLWLFILLGNRSILLYWIPLSLIADILFVGHGINNCTHNEFISDEIWFLNLATVILFRCYITAVIYQAFIRLVRNAQIESKNAVKSIEEGQPSSSDANANSNIPLGQPSPSPNQRHARASNVLMNHIGNYQRKTVPNEENSSSPRYLKLNPIGRWPDRLWYFYNDTPRLGAAVLVIFEVVWNVFVLSTRGLTEFLLGGRMFFMPNEEEVFMRIWRILLNLAAVFFIFQRRKTLLRFWLIIYFWTLFISLCIYVYILADWVESPNVVLIVTLTIWLWDNVVRFCILYFCLRVTSLPPPLSTELTRSHSLRSHSQAPSTNMTVTMNQEDEGQDPLDIF